MSRDWSRRNVLFVTLTGVCTGLSGCGVIGDSSVKKTKTQSWNSKQPIPNRPSDLTAANVVQYVAEHAQVTSSNNKFTEGATETQVTALASLANRNESTFYLVVSVTGTVDFPNGATPRFGKSLFYYVDRTRTIRAEHTGIKDTYQHRSPNGENVSDRNIEFTNFNRSQQSVSVVVKDTATDMKKTILDRSVDLPSTGGKSLSAVSSTGTYTVQISNQTINRELRWKVTESPSWRGLWIYISPSNKLWACGTKAEGCQGSYPAHLNSTFP